MKETDAYYRDITSERKLLNDGMDKEGGGEKSKCERKCSWGPEFKFSLFKNPLFSLYVFAFTLCMNGFGNNMILIPSHTKDLGYDKTRVSLGVSIMGGCEIFSRIFFGWFADRNIIKRQYIFVFSMGISSVFCFIAPQFESFEFIAVYAAIVGIFPGSFWSLMSVLVIEAVGIENFAPAFGLLTLCLAFGAVFSQPLIGNYYSSDISNYDDDDNDDGDDDIEDDDDDDGDIEDHDDGASDDDNDKETTTMMMRKLMTMMIATRTLTMMIMMMMTTTMMMMMMMMMTTMMQTVLADQDRYFSKFS